MSAPNGGILTSTPPSRGLPEATPYGGGVFTRISNFEFLMSVRKCQHNFFTGAPYVQASSSRRQDPRQARRGAKPKPRSGIVLPDTAKEKPKRGKVLSVGEGKRLDTGERAPIEVKKGDEVIFASYAGTEIKLDGEELMIMSVDDVLAVVES